MSSQSAPTLASFFVSPFLGATCTVFQADGACLIVDPGLDVARDVSLLVADRDLKVEAIFLTHGHLDHVADAGILAQKFGAAVIVGAGDEYRLDNPIEQLPSAFTAGIAQMWAARGWTKPATVRVLVDGDTLSVGSVDFRAWEVPGHTEGSTILVTDADIRTEVLVGVAPVPREAPGLAFTGDVLFAGTIGRTDLPGGNPDHMRESLRRISSEAVGRPQHLIVPGHGPVSTLGDELANNRFLSL